MSVASPCRSCLVCVADGHLCSPRIVRKFLPWLAQKFDRNRNLDNHILERVKWFDLQRNCGISGKSGQIVSGGYRSSLTGLCENKIQTKFTVERRKEDTQERKGVFG